MTKAFSFRQFLGMASLVLALLVFSSSFTSVSAASNNDLGLSTSNEVKPDYNDIIITDEDGNVLDPNELVITETPNTGEISILANIVSKQVSVTKMSMSGYFWDNTISYNEPSGLLTPWTGTLKKTKTYTMQGGNLMYYTVYSGTVYAQTR